MAQVFGQTQGMSKKPTSYADVLNAKPKINLFDFGGVKQSQPTQTKQMNFGQPVSQRNVTNFADYQSTLPKQTIQPTQKSGFSLFPTANAGFNDGLTDDELQTLINEGYSDEEIMKLNDELVSGVTQPEKESFIEGIGTKTKESFLGGIKRIGEAGVGLAEGKYTPTEAFLRGGAGALQSATSPIAGVLGETIETGIEKVPQDFKDYISTKTKPTIQDVTTWYNTLEPKRKRALDNLGVTTEVLLNFVGAGTAQKATPVVKQGLETTGNVLKRQIDTILPKTDLSKIDADTISKIRQAVRPSNVGIDTTGKYMAQDAKLLQGVKEVVKEGYTPKNAKEAMDAISNTKQKIWGKVQEANRKVTKTTNGDELADDIYRFTNDAENDDLFRANPELEQELIKYAEGIRGNKRFSNLTQDNLQELLSLTNSKIPSNSFLKQLDANTLQTQKNTVLSSILRDKIENNLMDTLGTTNQELRNSYGAVRKLEKDLAKRYGVFARQNPKGLLDFFGIEAIPDIAMGVITGNAGQVAKGIIQKGIVSKIKDLNNPNNIIRDIFKMQSKVKGKVGEVKPKSPLLLPAGKEPNKPLITPQTIEKGVIQESKIPLKLNKTPLKPNSTTNVSNKTIKKSSEDGRKVLRPKETEEFNTLGDKLSKAYKESAKKRFAEGYFTQTEINKGFDKLNSLYEGRKLIFENGDSGVIIRKPAYGKVQVEMSDGKIRSLNTSALKERLTYTEGGFTQYPIKNTATLSEVKEYLKGTEYKGYNLKPSETGRELLKKVLPSNFKEKAQDIVENLAEKVGAKKNLLPRTEKQVTVSDDLVKEAKKYNSAEEFVKDFNSKNIEIYHGGKGKTLDDLTTDFADELSKTNQVELGKLYAEGPGIYFTSSIKEAKGYGENIVKIKPNQNTNLITEKSPLLTKSKIKNIINDLPRDRVNIAIEDWGSLDDIIDNIYNSGNSVEQIQSIWADVLNNQNNKDFITSLAKNGIDGIAKKKGDSIHTIIYNKNIFKQIYEQEHKAK